MKPRNILIIFNFVLIIFLSSNVLSLQKDLNYCFHSISSTLDHVKQNKLYILDLYETSFRVPKIDVNPDYEVDKNEFDSDTWIDAGTNIILTGDTINTYPEILED